MFDGASRSAFSFRRETFAGTIEEGLPMLKAQWIEAGETDAADFALATERYLTMERAGALRVYTVRYHGTLVGFAAYFVFHGMHANTTKAAMSDAVGLIPAYRRPMVALRLMRFVETMLRDEDVRIMHTSDNVIFPGFGRLLEHLGHKLVSRTHAKVLTHA